MDEVNVGSVESALQGAFSNAAPEAPKPVAAPAAVEAVADTDPEALDIPGGDDIADDDTPEVEAVAAPELEIEIDVDGTPQVIRGNDQVKELVQRGLKAGRTFEENARTREALAAHVAQVQLQQQFTQAISTDLQELQSLDGQLAQYDKIDWNAAYDTNAFEALKLREQRDQLREQRAYKARELEGKGQQFQAAKSHWDQQILQTETQALLAKLPEWRNPQKAQAEKAEIGAWLANAGFNNAEIDGLIDHRHLLVVRKAHLYDKLMSNKADKVKQVRAAPVLARPGVANAQPNSRTDFQKARIKLKELGTKGNHRAQENIAAAMFEKAFK